MQENIQSNQELCALSNARPRLESMYIREEALIMNNPVVRLS